MDKPVVFLIDDDEDLREALAKGIKLEGYDVMSFASAADGLSHVNRTLYGVVVSDIRMPDRDGMDVLKSVIEIDPSLPVIMITGHGDVPLAVEMMQLGAYDFLEKPFPVLRLTSVIEKAVEKRRLVLENRALREELGDKHKMADRLVGRHDSLVKLRREVDALADTDADILLWGETGSGKDVTARCLHDFSSRSEKPYVAINCGALPSEMIESELFGHEQGAFTGASKQRIGKLEHANGGTVFLDEIESMPLDLQVKLLRVLEGRRVERLGSNKHVELNIRFIAATKTDLRAASEAGLFRADLYYRLNVVTLRIPPLRERRSDIPQLFIHLAREARGRFRREIPDVSPAVTSALQAYDWPGNVRELRNAADRFVLGMGLGLEEEAQPVMDESGDTMSLSDRVGIYEKHLIEQEIRRNDGLLKATYEALGLSRKGLYDKMRKYDIDVDTLT